MSANGRRRRRRKARRNGRRLSSNRRRTSRRRHRRNGSRSVFRKNGALMSTLKIGAVVGLGFMGHRLLSNVILQQVVSRLLPAPAPAAAGIDAAKIAPVATSLGVGLLGSFLVNAVVKDAETKKLLVGGLVGSALFGVVKGVLDAYVPAAGGMLAGPQDGTAAKLAAMFGLGAGASIMPRYAPTTSGVGEYFASGVGEYFASGVGEYFASGVSGLGAYGSNPDIAYEAAAGVSGQVVEVSGTHIDPSGDLDRQLNIAEAAAGVGALAPYEAAAGVGMAYEAAAGMRGLGNVTVPRANTWIPGMQDPSIWAGTVPVNKPQTATEMVPAGTLATQGGQGVFG
jgi:hypothetical protein